MRSRRWSTRQNGCLGKVVGRGSRGWPDRWLLCWRCRSLRKPRPRAGRSSALARPCRRAPRGLGRLPSGQTLSGDVGLAPRDPAALAAFAGAVSDPRSPLYRHYLRAGQFASAFGPAPATIAAVERHLQASGMRVTRVSRNGLLIGFRATAAQAEAAFATQLKSYRLTSGRLAFAPSAAIALPADIAPAVQAVVGLSTLHRPEAHPLRGGSGHPKAQVPANVPAPAAGPVACAAAKQDAAALGGLTDQQIADSYGVNGLYGARVTGAGQTIAVFELEPFSLADLKAFDACYFGAARAAAMLKRVHVVPVDGGEQAGSGSGESILDVDDVSALAPGATIQVYEAPPRRWRAWWTTSTRSSRTTPRRSPPPRGAACLRGRSSEHGPGP